MHMAEEETYSKYRERRYREAHNKLIFMQQLTVVMPAIVFGGVAHIFATAGGNLENPVCTSLICTGQLFALLIAGIQYRRYK